MILKPKVFITHRQVRCGADGTRKATQSEDARAAMGARSLSAKMGWACPSVFRASPEEHFVRLMPSRVDRPIDGVSKEDEERERHETGVQDLEAAACTVMTVPVRRLCLLVRNRLLHPNKFPFPGR